MITCKNCGYQEEYSGEYCSKCGKLHSFDEKDVKDRLSALDDALKRKTYAEALECYRILADCGYTPAEVEYAKILEKGQLCQRNLDMAMEYFFRAAEKHDAYAAYKYSRLATRENDVSARFWLIYSAILGCEEAYPVVAEEFAELGYEEDAHYYYSLAASCDDVYSIVTVAKRYFNGIGTKKSEEYAKWYMDKLKIPPIYAIKLAYKLRTVKAKEPPLPVLKNYCGLLRRMIIQAKKGGFNTARFHLTEILAERGDTDAVAMTGEALIKGDGCKQNFAEGLKLLTKAAAQKNVLANTVLGNLYIDGKYTDRNINLAIRHYKDAGEYEIVGDIFYTGGDIERNIAKAVEFYTLAAESGVQSAREKAEKIVRERKSLYEKANSQNPEEKFRLYALSADMGYTPAMLKLADAFKNGIGTVKNRKRAFLFYKRAAQLCDVDALLPLAECYSTGYGTKLDFGAARTLLTEAERCGVEGARAKIIKLMDRKMKKLSDRIYSLSVRLIFKKKFSEAKRYLDIAADLIHPKAIYTLGCLYEFGIGTDCDKDMAFSLYEKAYALSFRDPRASYKLKILKMVKAK